MPTSSRRQALILAVLLATLAGILWWNLWGADATVPAGAPAAPAISGQARTPETRRDPPADVRLEALSAAREDPGDASRNPFRFKPKAAPSSDDRGPAGPAGEGRGSTIPSPVRPAGPPPPPPIPLKFIGIVEEPALHRKLAALSDGRFTYYGREGDIIDGRYRIVRIGLESIEMVHVDGRGPQTIRLSGS